jgi:hypothetical protein
LQGLNQIGKNALAVLTRLDNYPINGVFIKIEDGCRSPNAVSFRHAADDHLDSLSRMLEAEECAVMCFREPFLASSALQHLPLMFPVSACFDDISMTSQGIMRALFVDAEVLVNSEHVFLLLRCACSIIIKKLYFYK